MPAVATRGSPPCVVLGVASSKRTRGLQAARAALGLAPARVVEWRDWLVDASRLAAALAPGCRFKIEPPGDDVQAHARLLRDGAERLGRAPCAPLQYGELCATDHWFAGFEQALAQLARQLAGFDDIDVVNDPAEIALMTDKWRCQQHLAEHGVATPVLLGRIAGFAEFEAVLARHAIDRVFVKARYGSSAAGVVAYRRNARGDEQATTSAHLVETLDTPRLFNDKRIRTYARRAEIARVIDLVAAQDAYVEAWVPKPRHGGGHFDLRVLALAGTPAHRVARVGLRPMTNLHLDSRRADPAALLSAAELALMEDTARRTARAFGRSRVIGVDLVVRGERARVLEANAFGDLLPGLMWQGRDTYAATTLPWPDETPAELAA
jgi:hypothetical protein